DRAAGRVELDVPGPQHRGRGGGGPAAERPHPGDELGEGERFGQVVVGAQGQTLDPVVDAGRGGEHEHPHDVAGGDQFPDQLVTVHTGQVAVEDHHVVPGEGGLLVALLAVVGHVD